MRSSGREILSEADYFHHARCWCHGVSNRRCSRRYFHHRLLRYHCSCCSYVTTVIPLLALRVLDGKMQHAAAQQASNDLGAAVVAAASGKRAGTTFRLLLGMGSAARIHAPAFFNQPSRRSEQPWHENPVSDRSAEPESQVAELLEAVPWEA